MDHHDSDPVDRRQSIVRLLAEQMPRRLRCFDSDEEWRSYLLKCDEAGDRVVRRQDTGKHSGHRKVVTILAEGVRRLPCEHCEPEFQRRMTQVGRCEKVSPGNAARRWLRGMLERGPMMARHVLSQAAMQGFHRDSIYRAAKRLHVVKRRLDPIDQESAQWSLPASERNRNFLTPAHSPEPLGCV